ncbi:uridylate kinase [uncultured Desulfatiglans sp.]|uniref:Uridylate kinase n=1 Tax=Uncultured Desulfatiglans sp. TaxID=1748965 RepID=A0A653ADL0_UNCDX|nr:uridylate kinase [uncultured Desulfatiglans sp.]
MSNPFPQVKRILLKLSGEALMGDDPYGIDAPVLQTVADEIAAIGRLGIQLGIVVGGGNIFRGLKAGQLNIGRVAADHMGMLATVINTIALAEALRAQGCEARILSAIQMESITEPFSRERAVGYLEGGAIVHFCAGTGNPFFTTDTAATIRALEIDADVLLKATKVDGVYDADPVIHPEARFFGCLTHREVLEKNLRVMDMTAISLAMERGLQIAVFNLRKPGNIERFIRGEPVGTLITGEKT